MASNPPPHAGTYKSRPSTPPHHVRYSRKGTRTWQSVGNLLGFRAPLRWPSHKAPGIYCSRPSRSTQLPGRTVKEESVLVSPQDRRRTRLPLGLGLTCLVGHVSHVGGVQVLGSVVVFQGCVKVFLLVGLIPQLLLFQRLDGSVEGVLSKSNPDGKESKSLAPVPDPVQHV